MLTSSVDAHIRLRLYLLLALGAASVIRIEAESGFAALAHHFWWPQIVV